MHVVLKQKQIRTYLVAEEDVIHEASTQRRTYIHKAYNRDYSAKLSLQNYILTRHQTRFLKKQFVRAPRRRRGRTNCLFKKGLFYLVYNPKVAQQED